jgi:hypothetical protein
LVGKLLKSRQTCQIDVDSGFKQLVWQLSSSNLPPWLALQPPGRFSEWIRQIGWCSRYFSADEVEVACPEISSLSTHIQV